MGKHFPKSLNHFSWVSGHSPSFRPFWVSINDYQQHFPLNRTCIVYMYPFLGWQWSCPQVKWSLGGKISGDCSTSWSKPGHHMHDFVQLPSSAHSHVTGSISLTSLVPDLTSDCEFNTKVLHSTCLYLLSAVIGERIHYHRGHYELYELDIAYERILTQTTEGVYWVFGNMYS